MRSLQNLQQQYNLVDLEPCHTRRVLDREGKITSNTIQSLKATVKPRFSESKTIVLDLTNVSYLDSSGLGAIVGL
jgi:anti-anti-sigma factor